MSTLCMLYKPELGKPGEVCDKSLTIYWRSSIAAWATMCKLSCCGPAGHVPKGQLESRVV